jgi:hypothetical protein
LKLPTFTRANYIRTLELLGHAQVMLDALVATKLLKPESAHDFCAEEHFLLAG